MLHRHIFQQALEELIANIGIELSRRVARAFDVSQIPADSKESRCRRQSVIFIFDRVAYRPKDQGIDQK